MNDGNQPPVPTTPRTQKFVLGDPVSLVQPNNHIVEGKIGGVQETKAGFIYTVVHASGVVRDVQERLREQPAERSVFLIIFSRRHSVPYEPLVMAIRDFGEALQLDDSVWAVRTDRTHAHLYDRLLLLTGQTDLMLITPMVPRAPKDWSVNPFTLEREAGSKLRAWLEPT